MIPPTVSNPVDSSRDLTSSSCPEFFGTLWPVDDALDGPRNGKCKEYILHLKKGQFQDNQHKSHPPPQKKKKLYLLRYPNHPKGSKRFHKLTREIQILPSKHEKYVLSFPHLLLMHWPRPWWSFLAWQHWVKICEGVEKSADLWRITKGMVQRMPCSCQNSISRLVDWDYQQKCFTVLCFSSQMKSNKHLKLYIKLGWVATSSSKFPPFEILRKTKIKTQQDLGYLQSGTAAAPGYTHPTEDIGKWCPCSCDGVAQDRGGNAKILWQRAAIQIEEWSKRELLKKY